MELQSINETAYQAGTLKLATKLPGKVYFATDDGYDAARRSWNLADDKRPTVVVFAENPVDVVEALTFAGTHRLPVAVQGTGHLSVGSVEGAVLINTSPMQELRVDPQTQTARVGAGVKWGAVLQQAQEYGLAPLLGSTTDVGAVGYSLGGGMGWLCRKHGLSVDSVISLEVVTPDGEFRRASPQENSDLFWALCGGGGGFGVVTAMEIQLYPVSEVYAGNLFYPPELAHEVFHRYREWVQDAPEELTCSIVVFNFPPLDLVPPPFRGKSFVLVRGCYAGPVEEGEKLMDYWRSWQQPEIDDFRARPFAEADAISMDPVEPSTALLSGEWLSDLTEEAADILIRHSLPVNGPPAFVFSEVRLAGGAICRADDARNAFCHRDMKYIWYSVALPMNPQAAASIEQALRDVRAELAPYLSGKVYMNFIERDEMRRRTREGFTPEKYQRLQAIKARYDPDYRFISSFDIPPAAAVTG